MKRTIDSLAATERHFKSLPSRERGLPEPFCWGGVLSRSGIAAAVNDVIRPKGPGCCDHNNVERVANVITSLPFVAIGVRTIQKRRTSVGKVYGASLAGVGAASGFFHASKGKWKTIGRKIDYWACALSSACLARCVFPDMPLIVTGISLGLTPVRPLLVTSLNTLAVEMQFYRRSTNNRRLKQCQFQHNAACAAGASLFCLEDRQTSIPLMHAAWHLISCIACGTTNGLLVDVERGIGMETIDDLRHLY